MREREKHLKFKDPKNPFSLKKNNSFLYDLTVLITTDQIYVDFQDIQRSYNMAG
jgi:hypothetical protein